VLFLLLLHCSAAPVVAPAAAALRVAAAVTVWTLRHAQSVHAMDQSWYGQGYGHACCALLLGDQEWFPCFAQPLSSPRRASAAVSMTMWPVETAKNAWERVQHAEVCHVMHESMWRILLMLAGASMPCSLFTLSSANTRAGWPRGRCGRCAIMRLSRPLETRMTRLERPRRRRESGRVDIARGPREVFSARPYSKS